MAEIMISTNTKQHIQRKWNPNTQDYDTTLSTLTAKVYNELLRKFHKSGFKTIRISLKTGENLTIKPCSHTTAARNLSDIEFFSQRSQ